MKKQRRIGSSLPFMWAILLSVLLVGLTSIYGYRVSANEIELGDNNVKNIQIVDANTGKSKNEYADGSLIKVTANYSGQIKAGTRIDLNWDNQNDNSMAYLTTFNNQKDIYLRDKNSEKKIKAGVCAISADEVAIIIDKELHGTYKVNGNFSFNLQVRNLDNKDHTLKIKLADEVAYVKTSANSVDSPDILSANIISAKNDYSNRIAWYLALDKSDFKNEHKLRLLSSLTKGQKIDPNSVNLSIYSNNKRVKEYSLKQLKQDFPDSKITISENQLYMVLDTDKLSKYQIILSFCSDITNNDAVAFRNNIYLNGKRKSATIQNINFHINIDHIDLDKEAPIKDIDKPDIQEHNINYDEVAENNDYESKHDDFSQRKANKQKSKSSLSKYNRYRTTRSRVHWDDENDDDNWNEPSKHHRHHNKLPQTNAKNELLILWGLLLVAISLLGLKISNTIESKT